MIKYVEIEGCHAMSHSGLIDDWTCAHQSMHPHILWEALLDLVWKVWVKTSQRNQYKLTPQVLELATINYLVLLVIVEKSLTSFGHLPPAKGIA